MDLMTQPGGATPRTNTEPDGDWALKIESVSKIYPVYGDPSGRLKEILSFGLLKRHTEFAALEDVNLTVAAGQTLGLVGRNGAGKSTLLKIVAGNLAPTGGNVRVRGRLSSILELGMGLQPNLTGRQNMKINALLLGLRPEEISSCLAQVIEFSELGEAVDWPLRTYSSGMLARLAFSILTAVRSDVVILDEALATGDVGFATKGRHLIRDFADSGATVIVVSHNLAEIEALCDRVLWLDKGRIVEDGDPREVLENYARSMPHVHFRFLKPEPTPKDLTQEPTRLVFQLTPTGPVQEKAAYPIASLSWVDDRNGRVLGTCRPQLELHQLEIVSGVRDAGILRSVAEAPWGDVLDDVRLFETSPDAPIYLSIRTPQQSEGGNIRLRVRYQDTQSVPLTLTLMLPGRAYVLGTLFGVSDSEWHEQDYGFPADSKLFQTLQPIPDPEPEPEAPTSPPTAEPAPSAKGGA